MKPNYISKVLHQFFQYDYPPALQIKVHKWMIKEEHLEEKDLTMHELWDSIDQEVDQSTYKALSKVRTRLGMQNKEQKYKWLYSRIIRIAAIIIPAILVISSIYFYFNLSQSDFYVELNEVATLNGENKQLLLPDGTNVWLNASSKISYPNQFNEKTRTIELTGEAFFSVEKNPEKPFIVKTKLITVEALGTEFNIEAYRNEDKTIATLNNGKIRIDILSKNNTKIESSYILEPDQQLIYVHSKKAEIKTVHSNEFVSWKEGNLIFQDITFNDILKKLERHYNISIEVDDYYFSNDKYSIRFVHGETIQQTMEVLKDVVGNFTYSVKRNKIILNKKP